MSSKLISFLKSDQFNKSDLEGLDIAAETSKFDAFLEGSGKNPLGLDVSMPNAPAINF